MLKEFKERVMLNRENIDAQAFTVVMDAIKNSLDERIATFEKNAKTRLEENLRDISKRLNPPQGS